MPYNTDDDEVLGVANNTSATYVVVDPDRYGLQPTDIKVVKNNFYKEGEVQTDANGKEIKQNKEQYQVSFKLFDPKGDPTEFMVNEQGEVITITEWYAKRDDGQISKKSRTRRLFESLLGREMSDNEPIRKSTLLSGRCIAMVVQKASQDGKTIRNKIARDSEMPYTAPSARRFGARSAAVATADENGEPPF